MRPSTFIWYELLTDDVDAAGRFYGEVVGWSAEDSGQSDKQYRQWSIEGAPVGGLMELPPGAGASGMKPMWLGYVHVPDVDASIGEIEAAGGALSMPATDIPGVGRIAMVNDPQGAPFYVMTPKGGGQSVSFAPGQPGHGGWHELHTSDWRGARDFYFGRLGWGESHAMDMGSMGTYLLFNTGADAVGGMMNSSALERPTWLYYFNVDDIDAARLRVEAAGGAVVNGPHEAPTGAWIIQARDPQGAAFALVGPHKA